MVKFIHSSQKVVEIEFLVTSKFLNPNSRNLFRGNKLSFQHLIIIFAPRLNQNSSNGATKKIQGDVLVDIPGLNGCINHCYHYPLALVDTHSAVHDHIFCEGNGYYVTWNSQAKKLAVFWDGIFIFSVFNFGSEFGI